MRSNVRLSSVDERTSPKRRTPSRVSPSTLVELDRRADDLEHARQHADADTDRLGDADQLGHLARVERRRARR